MNYCIHGPAINEYCPTCPIDIAFVEDWLGCQLTTDVHDFAALLHDAASI